MCCRCIDNFCYCMNLKNSVFVMSIIKMVVTIELLICSMALTIIFEDRKEFQDEIVHGVSSTVIFFTAANIICLSLLIFGIVKNKKRFLIPYFVYGIIYMIAYIVVLSYATPVLLITDETGFDIVPFLIVEVILAFLGFAFQIYFYIATCSVYASKNEKASVEFDIENIYD